MVTQLTSHSEMHKFLLALTESDATPNAQPESAILSGGPLQIKPQLKLFELVSEMYATGTKAFFSTEN